MCAGCICAIGRSTKNSFADCHQATERTRISTRVTRLRRHMSAFDPKRTWNSASHMSAFGGKADIAFAQDCRAHAQEIVTVELTPTNQISIGGLSYPPLSATPSGYSLSFRV